jgi:hypothetical protein
MSEFCQCSAFTRQCLIWFNYCSTTVLHQSCNCKCHIAVLHHDYRTPNQSLSFSLIAHALVHHLCHSISQHTLPHNALNCCISPHCHRHPGVSSPVSSPPTGQQRTPFILQSGSECFFNTLENLLLFTLSDASPPSLEAWAGGAHLIAASVFPRSLKAPVLSQLWCHSGTRVWLI